MAKSLTIGLGMVCYNYRIAPVAQLDRVLVSEAKGRGFDSRRARQIMQYIQ